VIVCDYCGKPIRDVKDGNAVWRQPRDAYDKPERFFDVQHTHKHCNWLFMNRRFPEPTDGGWCWMSHELKLEFFLLLENTKYDAREAEFNARLLGML
jgi:hypothetical protein